jgi:hypothetical protein
MGGISPLTSPSTPVSQFQVDQNRSYPQQRLWRRYSDSNISSKVGYLSAHQGPTPDKLEINDHKTQCHLKFDIFVLKHLDVEANRGNSLNIFFGIVLQAILRR